MPRGHSAPPSGPGPIRENRSDPVQAPPGPDAADPTAPAAAPYRPPPAADPAAPLMADLIAGHDWASTPLGPPDRWPQSLRTVVRILVTSRFAMWMGWGPDLTFLYNDAYGRMTLGIKHPWALGRRADEVWAEIWDAIGPRIQRVMETGTATWDEALLLFLERSGYREETYHTFSYSPLRDDDGAVVGMLCVVSEDTDRVIGERRLAILRDIAAGLASANDEASVHRLARERLEADPRDLPFALVYLREPDGSLRLAIAAGAEAGTPLAPVQADPESAWWVRAPQRGAGIVDVRDAVAGPIPSGAWDVPPDGVLVLPIGQQATGEQLGILVAGLNPYRRLDVTYRGFIELVAGQIAASIASARAYEVERRRAAALAELDRAKTELFSNISHEFRTPLTLMLGPIEDALGDRAGPRALPPDELRVVHRNAQRLLRLVNALLDVARIESGRLAADFRPTDLAALTADLVSMFRSATDRAGLRLTVDTSRFDRTVPVDPEMWEKIVLNLVSNAVKHTFEGGVTVRLEEDGSRARLTVEDTGVGIPADELDHVFDRFHRVTSVRSRTHEGTGIGLALVQSLVALHHGTVTVESEVDQGTRFTVTVPLEQAGAATGPPPRPLDATERAAMGSLVQEALLWDADLPGGGAGDPASPRPDTSAPPDLPAATSGTPRILVVDDNTDMRAYLARLLAPRYRVETASDGLRALDAAKRRPPDLVLSDGMMPRLDGPGLVRALRADPRTRHVPVILLSARAGADAHIDGLEAGADDYLVKPFSADELIARVDAHVRLAQQRRQALLLRDAFVGLVSHELRTPVTAIYGASRLIARPGTSPEVRASLLDDIVAESDRIRRLVEDLLALARMDGGDAFLADEPVPLEHVARRVAASAGSAWADRAVTVDASGPGVVVRADEVYTAQVIGNLLSNAAKYSPAAAPIRIEVGRDGERGMVSVLDEGVGIRPGDEDRLFQMYYRSPDIADRITGAGIGLYVCRQIVEAMGGGVWAAPRPDRGSAFGFWLPLYGVDPDVPG